MTALLLSGQVLFPAAASARVSDHVDGVERRLEIKGRCLLPGCKPGQRLGSIDVQQEFDAVLLALH